MRAGVIIARFPSGWRLLEIGEDTAVLKAAFKAIKVAGTHTVEGEHANCALYLDAQGDVRRKFLAEPEAAARVVAANRHADDERAAAARQEEEARAKSDGAAQAKQIAQKAVAVVAAEIAAVSADPAPAPDTAAAVVAATPAPAAPVADSTDADDSDEPAARFGGKRGNRKS